MESALALGSSSLFHLKPTTPSLSLKPTLLHFPISTPFKYYSHRPYHTLVRASSNPQNNPFTFIHKLKSTTAAILFAATAASLIGKIHHLPARAEPPPTLNETQEEDSSALSQKEVKEKEKPENSPLSQFLESNSEATDALKKLLQQKLESGEDQESLSILRKLVAAQPENMDTKFLMARLLSELGETHEAREVFEEILKRKPLSFEALFENALLMDRCGEGEEVIKRLEEALRFAEDENKAKEMRDVRLIMAQVQFLQKNVEEALRSYEQLIREDPTDFRPYFCKGMIYSLLDRNKEAKEQFAKYRELSPKKFEVEGYLRTPLSRLKLFGTDEEN